MASPVAPRRILIVEDHADTADTMAVFLRHLGHRVDVARSGYAGLVAAMVTKPEVILLDIEMPGMDGCEVACRLRATGEFDDVLIIAVTGYGRESDRLVRPRRGSTTTWSSRPRWRSWSDSSVKSPRHPDGQHAHGEKRRSVRRCTDRPRSGPHAHEETRKGPGERE